jgi:hypothetical protein
MAATADYPNNTSVFATFNEMPAVPLTALPGAKFDILDRYLAQLPRTLYTEDRLAADIAASGTLLFFY